MVDFYTEKPALEDMEVSSPSCHSVVHIYLERYFVFYHLM